MPISSSKLGAGTLTLGTGPLDVSIQVTACRLTPTENVTAGDAIKVLTLDQIDGDESVDYSFTLDGSFLQDDPGASSVVDWSWTNMGTEQSFTFVPNTAQGREATGTIKSVVPLSIGGEEVDATMSSDFSWRIKGTPTVGTV